MTPLDATVVLAIVLVCALCGGGGYLCGYFEGKAHGAEEARGPIGPDDLDDQGRDKWRP